MQTNTKWVSDPEHSELSFKIKHLMISSVTGKFNQFEVRTETPEIDFKDSQINLTAQVASISTDNKKRDQHLLGSDFFDATQFSTLEFQSSQLEEKGKHSFVLYGTLKMKGLSNKVKLLMKQSEIIKDPWGNERVAFTVDGEINRKNWGLDYNAALETGGFILGDKVAVHGDIQLVKQPQEA